jgi:hypothetical protein
VREAREAREARRVKIRRWVTMSKGGETTVKEAML